MMRTFLFLLAFLPTFFAFGQKLSMPALPSENSSATHRLRLHQGGKHISSTATEAFQAALQGHSEAAPGRQKQVKRRPQLQQRLAEGVLNAGASCGQAVVAVSGLNYAPQAPYWFKITLPQQGDGYLFVSSMGTSWEDTSLEIYDGCTGSKIAKSDDVGYEWQSEAELKGLTPGGTYYIYWADTWSNYDFEWTLAVEAPLPGSSCRAAREAVWGANTTAPEDVWYKVVLPKPGKLVITASDEQEARQLSLMSDCGGYKMTEGTNKLVKFSLNAATPYYLKWSGVSKAFDWTMVLEEYGPGELCANAVEAKTGINTTPEGMFWYKYTMPKDGRLVIEAQGENASNIRIYERIACSGGYRSKQGRMSISDLKQGSVVLLQLVNEKSEVAPMQLEIRPEDQHTGQGCTTPLPIREGVYAVAEPYQWYSFKMPAAGKLVFTKAGYRYGSMISLYEECNDDFTHYSQESNFEFLDLVPGKTYKIKVENNTSPEVLEWSLAVEAFEAGEICALPTTPVVGINSTRHPAQWYKVTLPANGSGYLLASSVNHSQVQTSVSLYAACDGEKIKTQSRSEGTMQAKLELSGLRPGGTYYLYWESPYWRPALFDWELSFTEPATGRACASALPAKEGLNQAPAGSSWHKFTVPYQARVSIKADNTDSKRQSLLYTSCDRYVAVGQDTMRFAGEPGGYHYLKPGQEYIIFWKDAAQAFEWSLEYLPVENGDACSQAKEVSAGQHVATHDDYWIRYRMPSDGALKIRVPYEYSSYYINAYAGCEGNYVLHARDDVQQSFILERMPKGTEIYVLLSRVLSQGGKQVSLWHSFDFEVEVIEGSESANCDKAKEVGEGPIDQGLQQIGFYKFTMPFDGAAMVVAQDSYDWFNFYDDCERRNELPVNYRTNTITGLKAGSTYYLAASADFPRAEAFKFTLDFRPAAAGEDCALPQQVDVGVNTISAMPYFAAYTLPADGNLMLEQLDPGLLKHFNYTVEVFDGCSGAPSSAQTIYPDQPLMLYDLKAGQTVVMKWSYDIYFWRGDLVRWNLTFLPAAAPKTYRWVGQSGSWSKLSGWRLSNGSIPSALPGPADHVVIDAAALADSEATLTIDGVVSIASLSWEASAKTKELISNSTIFIEGDITLQEGVRIEAPHVALKSAKLLSNGGEIEAVLLVENELRLADDARLGAVKVQQGGSLDLQQHTIRLRRYLDVRQGAAARMAGGFLEAPYIMLMANSTSNVEGMEIFAQRVYADDDATLLGAIKRLRICSMPAAEGYAAPYPALRLPPGFAGLKKLQADTSITIVRTLAADSLLLKPGVALRIDDGVRLKIQKGAVMTGKVDKPIRLEGYTLGRSGYLWKESGELMADHLELRDNTAEGGAYFYAQNSLRLNEQVFGWNGFKTRQEISFQLPATMPAGQSSLELNATASSGLPVRYEVVSGAASVEGNVLRVAEQSGPIVIKAMQPGNEVYDAARPVSRTLSLVTGTAEETLISSFDAYPVPLQGTLEISFTLSSAVSGAQLQLLSAEGRLVYEQTVQAGKDRRVALSLPVEHLPRGLYLIHITDGHRRSSRKVVK